MNLKTVHLAFKFQNVFTSLLNYDNISAKFTLHYQNIQLFFK